MAAGGARRRRAAPSRRRAHANTERARRFGRELQARFGLPVHEVDERYTTTDAKRAGAVDLDAAAAAIILEQHLAGL
jgi:putative Holliday junction resolvase